MAGLTSEERSRRPEYWLDIIEQARKHPGGVKGYCDENDIASKVYYRWFGKLRKDHPEWESLTKSGRAFPRKPRAGVREYWTQKVSMWIKSGLSVVDFCVREKLHPASLRSWKRKLELEKEVGAEKPSNGIENRGGKRPSFVPLTVVPEASAQSTSPQFERSLESALVSDGYGGWAAFQRSGSSSSISILGFAPILVNTSFMYSNGLIPSRLHVLTIVE